jgi:hypothetical protein
MSHSSLILAVCTVLFALRVFGQILVVLWTPRWLPSNEHWYSGLMPYRYLLPSQLALLAVMIVITVDVYRDGGLFAADWWDRAALYLAVLSWLYFGSMVVRYIVTMWLRPEFRWFRRTIPIWFHMVLAVGLWAFASYHWD